jgi:dTDP-4-amino-4,6-dideoxygalactose transaminase
VNWRIPLFDLDYGDEEERAVLRVIRSKWISQGQETESLEQEFSSFLSVPHAIATSSGTSALHLAYLALGVGPGDEVIVPSFTFIATVSPLLWIGAKPVFADIESLEVLNISRRTVEPLITDKTKGITFVHFAGYSRGIDEIADLCAKRGLFLLEDASHAHGANWRGKMAGTFGDAAVFSFFANKNVAAGEGGIVVTSRPDVAEKVKLMRSHGMTKLAWDKYESGEVLYDVLAIGYNYRMTELQAALARVQLSKLHKNNKRRRDLVKRYRRLLKGVDVITIPYPQEDVEDSSHYIFPIILDRVIEREKVVKFLKGRGIQTSVHYPAIHKFSAFSHLFKSSLPNTEEASRRELTLPLWPQMSPSTVEEVVAALKAAIKS